MLLENIAPGTNPISRSLIPHSSVLRVKTANVDRFHVANNTYSHSLLILNVSSEISLVDRQMTGDTVSDDFILSPSLNLLSFLLSARIL